MSATDDRRDLQALVQSVARFASPVPFDGEQPVPGLPARPWKVHVEVWTAGGPEHWRWSLADESIAWNGVGFTSLLTGQIVGPVTADTVDELLRQHLLLGLSKADAAFTVLLAQGGVV